MTGFVRRDRTQLLDADGQPRVFRGVGIGNWLLVEGYMWRFFAGATRPRQIEALIAEQCGQQWAEDWWQRFRDSFFTRDDVAAIKAAGFDHIRVPFNWRLFLDRDGTWRDEGFRRLDDVVGWCREAGLLVLFDLHGAPGGQTGANIDDSEHDRPELFEDPIWRELCRQLWVEIARRWADEPVVMGYDLLNEPLRDEFQHQHGAALAELYRDLTTAIREVDRNHLIMYEGSHWATNFSIFDQVWDENSCLQFHRYWDRPDEAGLEKFTSVAERLNLPLYMGEGGENSVGWLSAAFGSYGRLGISWNFWPWKKLENPSSPCDAPAPRGWDEMVAAAEGRGPAPSPERARQLWDEALDALRLANCRWHGDLVDAMLQAPRGWVPGYAAVGAFERHTFDRVGGDHEVNLFAADPRERDRAGDLVLVLGAGEQAEFRFSSEVPPDPVEVVSEAGSPVEVLIDGSQVRLVGGEHGSRVRGLRLG